jgi:hypothetical protein
MGILFPSFVTSKFGQSCTMCLSNGRYDLGDRWEHDIVLQEVLFEETSGRCFFF